MMTALISRISRALCAACIVTSVTDSASAGSSITLEFDGTTHVFTPQMDGARTGFTRFLSLDAVSMEGADRTSRLVLELSFPPGARLGDTPHDARISFRPDGWRDYWVSPPDFPQGAVVIEYLDLSGPAPRIQGQFTTPLCFTKSPIHPPDMARCQTAAGVFNTELVPD